MEQVLQYIIDNKDVIFDILFIIVGIVFIGRKRALSLISKALQEGTIDDVAPVIAKFIYNKLPKTAKLFVTQKLIEKEIIKFISTLDKK